MTPLEALVEDLEADLDTWGKLPLYRFSWFLRGLDEGLTEEHIETICHQAHAEVTSRHALHLEWFEWPDTSATGRRAAPGTALDFDIHTRGEIDSPFLALVPD